MVIEAREGGIHIPEYGIYLSSDQIRRIQDRELGKRTLARELDNVITENQTARVIQMIREPEVFISATANDLPEPTIEGVTGDDFRPDPVEVYNRSVRDYASGSRKEAKRKLNRISFEGGGPIAICWVADTHLGNKGTDVARAFREIKVVRDTPGMFSFFVGDLYDNFIIGFLKAVNMGQRATIEDQYALGQYYLEQCREKWLGYVSGNHEQWTLKVAGYDANRDIVPKNILYDTDEIAFELAVGEHRWKCIARHKWPGSSIYNPLHPQTRGSKFSRPGYDVYVGAHTHPGALAADHPAGDGRVISLIQCGTYKNRDSYARTIGFPETGRTTAVCTIFFPNGYHFSVANVDIAAHIMRDIYKVKEPTRLYKGLVE
jgi:hypothetical protein